LGNGRAARVGDDGLIVRFERVASDDRCPAGDVCVSEGDAVVVISAEQLPNGLEVFQLHSNPGLVTEGKYLRYRVKILRLEPRPVGEQPVPLPGYVATLTVSN
jgi:hypothetical protein